MDNLDSLVDARQEAMIGDLRNLLAIESVKDGRVPGAPFGPRVRDALDFVLRKGREMGFTANDIEGYAGHIEFGQGQDVIGILVHLDVVPAGEGWTHPPFGGVIADGRIYGRGAVDDKGPAIASLHALAALRDSGFQPRHRLRLILGCDEEDGWEDLAHYFAVEEKPLFGFTPDADFPVIMAEKGHLTLALNGTWSKKGEPRFRIRSVEGGTRANIVPEYCRACLACPGALRREVMESLAGAGMSLRLTETQEGFTVEAHGVAAHASLPENGENAIGRLFLGLRRLGPWLEEEENASITFVADRLGLTHDGRGFDLAFADDVSGSLTLNLGRVSWREDGLTITLDIRYPVTIDGNMVSGRIADFAAEAGLHLTILGNMPPLHVPADHPLVEKLMGVYRDKTGLAGVPIAIGGRTYASAIGTGVAFGPTFPGQQEVAHQKDEYIDLDGLKLCARIYAAAMAALAGG